jgi:ankyrin repeat protein
MFTKNLIRSYVSPLFVATGCNNTTLVKMLLKQIGNEYNLCNTSLISACMYGYQEIVTLLLEYDCDPNGSTEIRPLSSATEYGHTHVAELLLKHNSDPDLCDKNNMPPLLIAAILIII